jgi:hypothetical protein
MMPSHFEPDHKFRLWLTALLIADSAGLGLAALAIFRVSVGSGHAVALGLSAQGIALIGFTVLMAIGFLAAGLLTLRGNPFVERWLRDWLDHPERSIAIFAAIFLFGWVVAWTPAGRFGAAYYYALRLLPLAAWLAFACGTAALFLLAVHRKASAANWQEYFRQNKGLFLGTGITLLLILAVGWLASKRILDVTPEEEDYWYGTGVPVLAWQVLTAIVIGLGAVWGEKKFLHNGEKGFGVRIPVDVILFACIWVVAAILWVREPLQPSFMISPPYPPNFEFYPAADGQHYDMTSQYALIGQRLFNSGSMLIPFYATYFERPVYSAFLLYLHLLTGQNFEQATNVQAALFAVFPAIAYLLGKSMHSRGAGLGLATILTLRGVNGLAAGGLLENANQKMYLTDFPTALGLALILLFAIRWVRDKGQDWRLAGWVGGLIGLWGMVRPHMLFLLPAAGLLTVWLYLRQKRMMFGAVTFMIASYLAMVMPWVQFNGSGVSLIDLYWGRIQNVIRERYPSFPLKWPGGSYVPREVASSAVFLPPLNQPDKSIPEFVLDHFLNNLTLAPLSLPATLSNLELTDIIKHSEIYWTPYWNGRLSNWAKVLLPLNLMLVALGIGMAWKRLRLAGLLPLGGMLLYFLLNGLGRTSGGRYLVPADWVVILYYVLGLATLFEIVAACFGISDTKSADQLPEISKPVGKPLWLGLMIILVLFGIGSLIPMASFLNSPRYERLDKAQIAGIVETRYGSQLGISPAEMQKFLAQPESIVMQGRALYPRFIARSVNSMIPGPLFQVKLYSRMSFTIIGPQGDSIVIFASSDKWFPFPNTADVIVIGCWEEEYYVQAWAVIMEETGLTHLRAPSVPLACPLPEPVCDLNGSCR